MCLYTLESVVVAAQVLGGVQTVQAQPHFPRYLVSGGYAAADAAAASQRSSMHQPSAISHVQGGPSIEIWLGCALQISWPAARAGGPACQIQFWWPRL
eukprot:COSAG01_NODE_3575_length_5917_cov_239.201100_7_plen_98_part_00